MKSGVRYHSYVARIAILTASDSRSGPGGDDTSGDIIATRAESAGHQITRRTVLPDDRATIAATLAQWCDEFAAEVVITSGGTGLSARDTTPEATRDIAERDVPGIPIALAIEGLKKTPFAVLSRGIAVTRKQTLIVNLPGNPKAVDEGMDVLLPLIDHIAKVLSGPMQHRSDSDTGHASA